MGGRVERDERKSGKGLRERWRKEGERLTGEEGEERRERQSEGEEE